RVAPGRALSARRLHRDEHEPIGRAGGRLLQQARHVRAMDQGGKGAIKWTRLSCRTFAANAVRLQLHALAYNLGNFLRTLATPEPINDWSLTSLKEKLIKIGAKVVSSGRYVAFQMAEVTIPKNLFTDILRMIAELRPPPQAHPRSQGERPSGNCSCIADAMGSHGTRWRWRSQPSSCPATDPGEWVSVHGRQGKYRRLARRRSEPHPCGKSHSSRPPHVAG